MAKIDLANISPRQTIPLARVLTDSNGDALDLANINGLNAKLYKITTSGADTVYFYSDVDGNETYKLLGFKISVDAAVTLSGTLQFYRDGTWYSNVLITVTESTLSYLNVDETGNVITDLFQLIVVGPSGDTVVIEDDFSGAGIPDNYTTLGSGNRVSGEELLLDTTLAEGVILDHNCKGKRTLEFNYVGDGNSNKIRIYVESGASSLSGSYIDITTKNWATTMGGSDATGGEGAEYFVDGAPIKVEVTDTRVKLWEDSTYVGYWDGDFADGYFAVVTGASGDQIGMDNVQLTARLTPSVDVFVQNMTADEGYFTLSNMSSVNSVNITLSQNSTLTYTNGTIIQNGTQINSSLADGDYHIVAITDNSGPVLFADPVFVGGAGTVLFILISFSSRAWNNRRRR
jgi:hypothetical protein